MNHPSRKFVAVLRSGVFLFCSHLLAQTAASEAGLIGKRYAGLDYSYDHFSGSTVDQAMGAHAVLNTPLTRAVDLNVGYSYLDLSGDNFDGIDKGLSASLVTHRQSEYGTGYFAATLGHAWNHATAFGVDSREHNGFWGVRAGYEVPVGTRSAVNGGIGFSDAFGRNHARAQVLRYYGEANHWFSHDLAGVVSLSYRQIKESPDAISYTAGLRWAF
jgi:hypothetical protein